MQVDSSTTIASSTSASAAISSGKPWSTVANVSRPDILYPTTCLETLPTVTTLTCHQGSRYMLPTALVDVRNTQNRYVTCSVLLDSASELSYISERCARALGVPRSPSRIAVSGISSVKAETTCDCCTLYMKSKVSQDTPDVSVHVLSKITSAIPTSQINTPTMEQLKDLNFAVFNASSPIGILLGVDQVWKIFTFNNIFDSSGNPIAASIIFGCVVTSVQASIDNVVSAFVTTIDIDRSLPKFWQIEKALHPLPLDAKNVHVETHFLETHARHSDGKYIVELPFREKGIKFGNTLQGATLRFNAVERRQLRDSHLRKQYIEFMNKYTRLGHMRELKSDEVVASDSHSFYMPHHPIIKPKLHVVFVRLFQDTSGVSLNSTLHTGPSTQPNLFDLCLRFCLHKYIFSADIVKMFRQIWVSENHRNYQRIVWREDSSEKLKYFILCTVTYGTSCAPFLSVRVLEQLAKDHQRRYPLAAKIILEDFCVDDVSP
ncbi:uncharacterized protein LOC119675369 [Teleopsis dalmanni]|uniref:uncharacterized protein LOC119675369 n=1 Tax=Teleopsis dalmanni TaxID=139649 RepID=UPI0018CD562C|nr:uncharacterized protein LOC119675369 [Teleopsis dalmanni]